MTIDDQQPPRDVPPESSAPESGEPAPARARTQEPPRQGYSFAPSAPASAKPGRFSPLTLVLGLSAAFFVIFLIISTVLLFPGKGDSAGARRGGGALFGSGSVAVVELNGVIMDSRRIVRQLESFEKSDEIKAVVLRLNSPGGAVGPSQEIYDVVRNYKKPVVASMSSVAASGALYIAMGAKKVYANAGTITGSIGVIMEFMNLEKLYEWAKIRRYAIKTGKFKDVGAEYREMSEGERQLLQDMVDDVLAQFKQAVAEGRKLEMDQVTAIADGRIFSGKQAKGVKLIDELGTLRDAIREAGKMGGIKGEPAVVYPEKSRRKLLDLLIDNSSDEESAESAWAGLVNLVLNGGRGAGGGASAQGLIGLTPGIYWLWTGPH